MIANSFKVYPEHVLYFSSCIGVYYVLPEIILDIKIQHNICGKKSEYFIILAVICMAFYVFFPVKNFNYNIETMGCFDKCCRVFSSDLNRMIIFCVFSYLAFLRVLFFSFLLLLFPTACLCLNRILFVTNIP